MLGLFSAIARVGGISAPWVAVYLPAQVFTPIHSTLDFVERTLFPGNGAPCMVALRLWELLRRGGTPGCTLSHGVPWASSPQHLRGFCQTHIFVISLSRIWRGWRQRPSPPGSVSGQAGMRIRRSLAPPTVFLPPLWLGWPRQHIKYNHIW